MTQLNLTYKITILKVIKLNRFITIIKNAYQIIVNAKILYIDYFTFSLTQTQFISKISRKIIYINIIRKITIKDDELTITHNHFADFPENSLIGKSHTQWYKLI